MTARSLKPMEMTWNNTLVYQVIDAFLSEQDILEGSKDTYKRNLKQFFQWLHAAKISQPVAADIIAYKKDLLDKNLSPLSISNYITAVKQFFNWAYASGLYANISMQIKPTSGSRKGHFCKDALSGEQALVMLNSIDRSTMSGKRDYALVNLMLRCGLQSIEVVRANIGDLQQKEHRQVLWIQGKGRLAKDEFIVLNDDSLTPLKEYINERGPLRNQDPLFVSLSNRNDQKRLTTRSIRRVVKIIFRGMSLDSPRFSCHSLRHTAVTFALKGGAEIREVQRMARHASVLTTERYAHDLDTLDSPAEDAVAEFLDRKQSEK